MRIWSTKFEWLDSIGLVVLWRESLLARAVLEGNAYGYANHPQLERFKGSENPLVSIETYLYYVIEEAKRRGFDFNNKKINITWLTKVSKFPYRKGSLTMNWSF